jgi:hypothetical protein
MDASVEGCVTVVIIAQATAQQSNTQQKPCSGNAFQRIYYM